MWLLWSSGDRVPSVLAILAFDEQDLMAPIRARHHEEYQTTRNSKRKPESSKSSSDEDFEGLCKDELLKAHEQRMKTLLGLEGPPSPSIQTESDEEWHGIDHESSSKENGLEGSITEDQPDEDGSNPDFDDDEDLLASALKASKQDSSSESISNDKIIEFHDPSRSRDMDSRSQLNHSERNSFMASALKKQLGMTEQISKQNKVLNKKDEEEAKLESLDRSLANLVSHLSRPQKSTSENLDAILSSNLPPLEKDRNPQRHPRAIKAGMARAKLRKSLAADREAMASGTVRARNSKTLTKRQQRVADGTEERERKARKARRDHGIIKQTKDGGRIAWSQAHSRELNRPLSQAKSKNYVDNKRSVKLFKASQNVIESMAMFTYTLGRSVAAFCEDLIRLASPNS
ncbi:hypothetical protein O181_026128 [Austropuccinia psidii MF-1]|uniref:Uncharacterized protein n=1 Tax=Austropuccinia psidii MF-1 TaxID=1389203 RepID=A0A9Q3GZR1_9BASI|nr:hypothetical protein [Austropuccinia psidii MF-1]